MAKKLKNFELVDTSAIKSRRSTTCDSCGVPLKRSDFVVEVTHRVPPAGKCEGIKEHCDPIVISRFCSTCSVLAITYLRQFELNRQRITLGLCDDASRINLVPLIQSLKIEPHFQHLEVQSIKENTLLLSFIRRNSIRRYTYNIKSRTISPIVATTQNG